jgi:hypothetical protein
MAYQSHPHDTVPIVVPEGETVSATVHIGNPAALGLQIPALGTNATVTVQVGSESDGSDRVGLATADGTATLVVASSAGSKAIDCSVALGFSYLTVVLGAAQATDTTFLLHRKQR